MLAGRECENRPVSESDRTWDVVVVGGGIAGLSIAARLSAHCRVAVLEKEPALAAHTTGRSVATFIQSYGNAAIQRFNAASLPFFRSATSSDGVPFARLLPFLYAASARTVGHLDTIYDGALGDREHLQFVDGAEAVRLCPVLRPQWVVRALVDPSVLDIDVHALLQHHAAALRAGGGALLTGTELAEGRRHTSAWSLTDTRGNSYSAGIVVNAANAWADSVAARCGAAALGVTPLKRSVFTLEIPDGIDPHAVPMVNAADEEFYFKPDAGRLLCSPADETPTDAAARGAEQPDEVEIARALDAVAEATVLDTRHVRTTWGGLRCFTRDRTPLIGWDRAVPGLFWYSAFGGYGIQTSPAASAFGASLVMGEAGDSRITTAVSPAREGLT